MDSAVKKRSIIVQGHKTSVSLEVHFWQGLKAIAREQRISIGELVTHIDLHRRHANLSSAIRASVLAHCVAKLRLAGERSPIAELDVENPMLNDERQNTAAE